MKKKNEDELTMDYSSISNNSFLSDIKHIDIICKKIVNIAAKSNPVTKFDRLYNMSEIDMYASLLIPKNATDIVISHTNPFVIYATYIRRSEKPLEFFEFDHTHIISKFEDVKSIISEYNVYIHFDERIDKIEKGGEFIDKKCMTKEDIQIILNEIVPSNANAISINQVTPIDIKVKFNVAE